MTNMIIAFSALAGAGKTTAANYLVEKYGFVKVNFKDALVQEMKDKLPDVLNSLASNQTDIEGEWGDASEWGIDRLFKEKPPIMRALMQNYGTEVRRGDDPEYWTKRWKIAAEMQVRAGKNVVVDDCRFLNEAQAILDMDGIIVRIIRSDIHPSSNHQSEIEMTDIQAHYNIEAIKGDVSSLYGELDLIIPAQES